MNRYNRKALINIGFKDSYKIDGLSLQEYETYFEDDEFVDVIDELGRHIDFAHTTENLDLGYIENEEYYIECDYCSRVFKKTYNRSYGGILTSKYVDGNEEYPSTDDCCLDCRHTKAKLAFNLKYGVDSYFQTKEHRDKFINMLNNEDLNWAVPYSRPQLYISNLLNGELNQHIKEISGFADIVLEDEKIIIEYDGSGHYLAEYFKNKTREELIEKDYQRDLITKELGYKTIRINSESDFLPSDEVIINKINEIKNIFKTTDEWLYHWKIPKGKRDKSLGHLRKITKEDVNE